MNGLMLLLFSIVPHGEPIHREDVDLIERSAVYDDCGKLVLEQVIAWRWVDNHHEVIGWRLMTDKQWQPPSVTWWEGEKRFVVTAKYWRESWEQFDPELVERERFPKELRRGLFGVRE